MLNKCKVLLFLLLSRHLPVVAGWLGGVRRRGIQGRDNSTGKGLEARERLVHAAKFRSSVSLPQNLGLGEMQDGSGERRGRGWIWALGLMSALPSQTAQLRMPRLMQAGQGEGGQGRGRVGCSAPSPTLPCAPPGAVGCQLGSLTQKVLFPHAIHVTSGNDQNSFALAKRLVLRVCSLVSERNSCCF